MMYTHTHTHINISLKTSEEKTLYYLLMKDDCNLLLASILAVITGVCKLIRNVSSSVVTLLKYLYATVAMEKRTANDVI